MQNIKAKKCSVQSAQNEHYTICLTQGQQTLAFIMKEALTITNHCAETLKNLSMGPRVISVT